MLSRSSKGTELTVLLPREIPGVIPKEAESIDNRLEDLDFFNTPELRLKLLKREGLQCFYCLRQLAESDYTVDHILPQADGGTHSYKNVVACCFECNSRKQAQDGTAFLLQNYRDGLLTAEEYRECLHSLEVVTGGNRKPDLSTVV